MRVSRTRATSLVLAALLLTSLPAAAVPVDARPGHEGDASAPELGLPEGARTVAVAEDGTLVGARSGLGELLGVRDHRDRRTWLDAIASRAERTSGLQAVGVAAEDDEDDEDLEEHWQVTGSFASARPLPDIDGDGLPDLIVADHDLSTGGLQLRAVRGTDGQELWRHPFGGEAALAFPLERDVDGDGVDDLLRFDLSFDDWAYEETSDDGVLASSYEARYTASYSWEVGVISGADGAVRWTRDIPGELVETYTEERSLLESSFEYAVEGTAVDLLPLLLDGEVATATLDVDLAETSRRESTVVEEREEWSLRLGSATSLDVHDAQGRLVRGMPGIIDDGITTYATLGGSDGDDLLRTTARIPEMGGECRTTVLGSECSMTGGEASTELERLDGRTFATRWSDLGAAYRETLVIDDLDGDGAQELLDLGYDPGESPEDFAYTTTLRSGDDGAARWARPDPSDWGYPMATTDLGGSPAQDLLLVSFEWSEDASGSRLDRVDGETGATLSSSWFDFPQSETDPQPGPGPAPDPLGIGGPLGDGMGWSITWHAVYAGLVGDLDDDGRQDLGAGSSSWTFGSEEDDDRSAWEARLETGPTAEVLHAEGGEGYGYLWPLADVDGDGDVELERYVEGEEDHIELVAWPLLDVPLWQLEPIWLQPAGDQDGTPGEELLRFDHDWSGDDASLTVSTTISSLEGETARTRWSLTAERDPSG